MVEEGGHPLDGEDISVTVNLVHGPTLSVGIGVMNTDTEDGISVTDTITKAGQQAMDELLSQMEQLGG